VPFTKWKLVIRPGNWQQAVSGGKLPIPKFEEELVTFVVFT
jgi:hypothetical protein